MAQDLPALIARAEELLARIEALLPPAIPDPDWKKVTAARWRKQGGRSWLQGIAHPHVIRLDDLVAVDEQKHAIDRNTKHFVAGLPANNVLLTGSRGTGKSSLVKAMLAKYAARGLRLIEVEKGDLVDLPDIADRVAGRPERFIVFCDDLTFDAGDSGYRALKVMLDGSIAGGTANLLIYATSNRRHMLPEYFSENLETRHVGEEVHPGESVEEKISLSERFGLWISFYPFGQDDYLAAVAGWLAHFGVKSPGSARDAQALTQGSAAVGALPRLPQRPRCLAVREELRRRPPARSGRNVERRTRSRGGGRPAARGRRGAARAASCGQALRRLLGVSRAASSSPAKRPRDALTRELREELGIEIRRAAPWFVQEFVYPHAHVELHFFRVFEWDGELVGHDGQAFAWQAPGSYTVAPLCRPTRAFSRHSRCRPSAASRARVTSAKTRSSRAPNARSTAACA